ANHWGSFGGGKGCPGERNPPVTEQPAAWVYCAMGWISVPGPSVASEKRLRPSETFQPKLTSPVVARGNRWISSISPCPTSPIQRSPVARSKLYRHGFRRPIATSSGVGL